MALPSTAVFALGPLFRQLLIYLLPLTLSGGENFEANPRLGPRASLLP